MRRSAIALVTVALAAGCSGTSSHSTAIEGRFVFTGGLTPGQRPIPGQITASSANLRQVVNVGADGNFRITVPPGTYTLIGRSPNFIVNGVQAPCYVMNRARIEVLAGVTDHVVVVCEGV